MFYVLSLCSAGVGSLLGGLASVASVRSGDITRWGFAVRHGGIGVGRGVATLLSGRAILGRRFTVGRHARIGPCRRLCS